MLSEKLTGVRIRVLGALRRFWTDGGFAVDRPWLLAAIVAVGAYFRIVDLGINPAGFFCDEAWIGNTAMKLMETGRDDGGARWPLLFRAFAGWRTSSVVYPAIPLVALFGPSEFSVRLASALFGLASIYVVYLLAASFAPLASDSSQRLSWR